MILEKPISGSFSGKCTEYVTRCSALEVPSCFHPTFTKRRIHDAASRRRSSKRVKAKFTTKILPTTIYDFWQPWYLFFPDFGASAREEHRRDEIYCFSSGVIERSTPHSKLILIEIRMWVEPLLIPSQEKPGSVQMIGIYGRSMRNNGNIKRDGRCCAP